MVINSDSTYPLVISPAQLNFSSSEEIGAPLIAKVKNVSDQELKIKIIDFPLGFVESKLTEEVIRPKEEIELVVNLGQEPPQDHFSKSITLEVNDKDKSRFSIPIIK